MSTMRKPLTREDYTYRYSPYPRATTRQKLKRFFERRKPLFWTLLGALIYPSLIGLMQLLDYMDGVR